MRQFFKVLLWVVILGAISFCVYTVLPEYPQTFVKSFVQPVMNNQAKTRIEQVKNLKNQDVETTYRQILEGRTTTKCWAYEAEDAIEKVVFFGKAKSINLKDIPDYDGLYYTSCTIKFEFVITGNEVNINAYVDGKAIDDKVRAVLVSQLISGTDNIE